jgi:hypothetical protein
LSKGEGGPGVEDGEGRERDDGLMEEEFGEAIAGGT